VKKIPALLYVGKGSEYIGPSVIFDPFPQPTGLGSTDLKSQKGLYSGPSIRNTTPLFFFSVIPSGYQGVLNIFHGTCWVSGYNRVSQEKCRGLVFVHGIKASTQGFKPLHKNIWERG
jgi:hypothetical protein